MIFLPVMSGMSGISISSSVASTQGGGTPSLSGSPIGLLLLLTY